MTMPPEKTDPEEQPGRPRRRTVGITALLTFGIGGLVTLAVTGVAVLGFWVASTNTRTLLGDRAEAAIDAIEFSIDTYLQPVDRMAALVAEMVTVSIEDGTPIDTNEILAMNRLVPNIRGVGIFYRDGRQVLIGRAEGVIRGQWDEDDGIHFGFEHFDKKPLPRWIDPIHSDVVDDTLIIAQHPIIIDGRVEAFAASVVKTSALSGFLNTQGLPEAVGFILVGPRHRPSKARPDAFGTNLDETPMSTRRP